MLGKGILILMAAYNGERYIAEQIESIRQQTFHEWHLMVRDDGSSDNTRSIVRNFSVVDPRIQLVEDEPGRLGPAGNFNRLMEIGSRKRKEHYIALADQDDVWDVNKLKFQIEDITRMEENYEVNRPLLIHSDLEIVKKNLAPLHRSFARFQNIPHPDTEDLHKLVAQNVVVGNTILINRPLLNLTVPVPEAAHMHDWWLALCAAVFGSLSYNSRQLVKYRLHSKNVTEPVGFWPAIFSLKKITPKRLSKMNRIFVASLVQANALRERIGLYSNKVPQRHQLENKAKALNDYLEILQLPAYRRPVHLIKTKIRRQLPILSLFLYGQALSNHLIKEAIKGIDCLRLKV